MKEAPRTERFHSFDAARGILMMLGLVLHGANVYSVDASWLISDAQRSSVFDLLISLIHVFRMPTFYWISGFFVALTFTKKGSAALLSKRARRVLVPLVASWATLNVLQKYLLSSMHGGASISSVVREGVELYHLWFLLDLLVYVVLAAAVLPWLSQRIVRIADWRPSHWSVLLFVLGCVGMLFTVVARGTGIAYISPFGLTSLYRLATYAPYFFVGMAMYFLPTVRQMLLSVPSWLLVVFIPAVMMSNSWSSGHGRLIGEVALFVAIVMTWGSIGALLGVFSRIFRQDSVLVRLSNEISYTVYLFHHLTVVLLGLALSTLTWGASIKFLLLTCLTFTVTFTIHLLLVRRITWLSLAFNGRWPTSMPDGFVAWLTAPDQKVPIRPSSP